MQKYIIVTYLLFMVLSILKGFIYRMKKIGLGRQAEVFEDNNGLAIKIYNTSVPIENIEYEAEISKKIYDVYNRAPKFYNIWHQNGSYGLQFELIKGEMLSIQMRRHLNCVRRYAREFGKLHREIHANSIKGLKSSIEKYEWGLRQYKKLDESILYRLLEFVKNSHAELLCHGDLHPENIMIDENGYMRVIDWVDAYSGNPLSDVARTYYLLSKGTSPEKKPYYFKLIESIVKRVIAKEYLHSYFSNKVIPKREFDIWKLIIQICRYNEGIQEEKPFLERNISIEIDRMGKNA